MKKVLTTADRMIVSYRSPEVTVAEISAEGLLCTSAINGTLSVEEWETGEFTW